VVVELAVAVVPLHVLLKATICPNPKFPTAKNAKRKKVFK
jgi:hypothetical protein